MTTQRERSFAIPQDIREALRGRDRLTRNELAQIQWNFQEEPKVLTPEDRDRYFSELRLLLGDDLILVQTALNKNQTAIKEFDTSTRASLQEVRSTIEKFDQSSRRLTRWLIGLTVVLVVLTGVIAWFTILLARRG